MKKHLLIFSIILTFTGCSTKSTNPNSTNFSDKPVGEQVGTILMAPIGVVASLPYIAMYGVAAATVAAKSAGAKISSAITTNDENITRENNNSIDINSSLNAQ